MGQQCHVVIAIRTNFTDFHSKKEYVICTNEIVESAHTIFTNSHWSIPCCIF
jgi:hypothetical protein